MPVRSLFDDMKSMVVFLAVLLTLGVRAEDAEVVENYNTTFLNSMLDLLEYCLKNGYEACVKEEALRLTNKLPNSIELDNGLTIKPVPGSERNAKYYFEPEKLPEESRARSDALDMILANRVLDYLSTHTFEFKVPAETINSLRRSLDGEEEFEEEGRKKKKKGIPLSMLFQLKAVTLGALMLKAVAMVAFKALMIGKTALLIAAVLALKKLLEDKHHSSTYEVVAHPHFDDHGHYDRSFNQELPYRGHEQPKTPSKGY